MRYIILILAYLVLCFVSYAPFYVSGTISRMEEQQQQQQGIQAKPEHIDYQG